MTKSKYRLVVPSTVLNTINSLPAPTWDSILNKPITISGVFSDINLSTVITDYTTVDLSKIAVVDNTNKLKVVDTNTFTKEFGFITGTELSAQITYLNKMINTINNIDSKIIGYLYGGYKDSVSIDKLQKFDTTTNTSLEILTTGNRVMYCPGITLAESGYFEHDNNHTTNAWYWRKFNFSTETLGGNITSTTPTAAQASAYNMGVGTKAFISSGSTANSMNAPLTHTAAYWTFTGSNETFNLLGLAAPTMIETTRQAANNATAAFLSNMSATTLTIRAFTFSNDTIANSLTYTRTQYPVGLSKDNANGFFVDLSSFHKLNLSGSTINSIQTLPYNFHTAFGESHSVQNYKYGFVMAGYNDTVSPSEYGKTQHGYAASYEWNTEVTTRLANLVHPQSSGQMVQR